MWYCLIKGFCPLKIKITQFPNGFRLKLTPAECRVFHREIVRDLIKIVELFLAIFNYFFQSKARHKYNTTYRNLTLGLDNQSSTVLMFEFKTSIFLGQWKPGQTFTKLLREIQPKHPEKTVGVTENVFSLLTHT